MNLRIPSCLLPALLALTTAAALAQSPPDTAALLARQREAIKALAHLDGTWRGSARLYLPGGAVKELTQTERVGSLLEGSIKLIEGRSYNADGRTEFNAFAVVSFDAASGRYQIDAHAQGHAGRFEFEPRPDGFAWRMVFGPVTIRHVAVVKDGRWDEVSERLMQGQPPVKISELALRRVGDTDWPAAGAVPRQ